MLHGLQALADDPSTEVIVLVSKPPSAAVAETVLAAAEKVDTPVIVIFLGAEPEAVTRPGVYGARYLAQAADMAVALSRGGQPSAEPIGLGNQTRRRLGELARSLRAGQDHVRGVFSGGTFCYEAQLVHAARGITGFSNAPTAGYRPLRRLDRSDGNTIIDMGDDEFTQGRPHPMIDPSLRDARIAAEAADPSTAVVLFDVVLGYGSSLAPVDGLTGVIATARAAARAQGRSVAFIGYVCGTDTDPQDRAGVVAALDRAGVLVASSNAEAATWSAEIITLRQGSTS